MNHITRAWRTLPFDEVFVDETGGNTKTLQSDFLPHGVYPIVDQGKNLVAGYTNEECRVCKAALPVIVFGDHTRAVKYIDFPFCLGADGTKILRSRIKAHSKYLYHYLRTVNLPSAGYSRHFKYLRRIQIPLPLFAEQRRIAAILDQADALRAKRHEALAKLDEMAQAIFVEMFGDPRCNSRGLSVASLRKLGRVQTGSTPPSSREGMFGGVIPFVTPGDLGSCEPSRRTVTDEGAAASRIVRAGATLVCCIGATIGKMDKSLTENGFATR